MIDTHHLWYCALFVSAGRRVIFVLIVDVSRFTVARYYDVSVFLPPLLSSTEDAMDLEWWNELQNAHR